MKSRCPLPRRRRAFAPWFARNVAAIPIFTLALVAAGWLARPAAAGDYIQQRGGCANSFRKFAESQKTQAYTKIAFFGGTAAAGEGASKPDLCYRALLMRCLRSEHRGATLAENNSAIAGSGAWLGAFRTKTDALYGGAALVLVDFAADDGDTPPAAIEAAAEGIVRQVFGRDGTTDVVFLYTPGRGDLTAYAQGRLPERVAAYERVAEHYKIPSVNLGRFVADKIAAGGLTAAQFSADGLRPTDRGHALLCEGLKRLVKEGQAAAAGAVKPGRQVLVRHTLPKPLSAAAMQRAQCVPYEWAVLGQGWKPGQKTPVDRFMHVLCGDQPGATLTLRFKGSQVGYFDAVGPDSGNLEFSVDGGPWTLQKNFDPAAATPRAQGKPLATGLAPAAEHELRLRIAAAQPAGSQGRAVRIGWLLVDGDVADPLARPDALARIDAVYGAMDPVPYTPPAERWRNLDRTRERLRTGPALRIVMLGDSIMGDTSSSRFELLLERMYPKCKIEKIASLRGSTGCWYYKLDNHVEEYVLRHKPDLLMIGGISQREDVASIREVIHQVRAKQSPEIMLLTPAFGALPDRHIREWTFDIPSAGDSYRTRLRRLAGEEHCGFIDMTGPWWRYVQQSGKDYGWFQRDRVHANERGFQILGRILEQFFAPEPGK